MGVWAHDSWYSLGLYQRLGYTGKSVRIGFIHYNSPEEVDRLAGALNGLMLSRGLSGRALPVGPAEDLGELVQVDVAARDHADDLPGAGPAAQRGRRGGGPMVERRVAQFCLLCRQLCSRARALW